MSWYVIDAVDRAVERTRKCLLEPFDIWKWIKLTIIAFFIGGGGFNSGGGGNSGYRRDPGTDLSQMPSGIIELMNNLRDTLMSYPLMTLVIWSVVLIVLFVILLRLIGSVMEFVFVESLVRNEVQIKMYFGNYLVKGLSLFILRILVGLGILLFAAVIALPLLAAAGFPVMSMINEDLDNINALFLLLPSLFIIVVLFIFVVAILAGIINSFINLAIPVSMYSGCSIFSALGRVLRQFRRDWQQIAVYWIGRLVLAIAVGIIVAIAGVLVAIALLIMLVILDIILYFALSAVLSDTAVWIMLILVLVIEFILFILVMTFIGMPAKVFMKYHMLSFLQKWYPMKIPMFDTRHVAVNSNIDEWLDMAVAPED